MWALLAQLVQQQLPQQQAALASLTAAVNQYGKTHGPGIALLEACHSGSALLVAALLELGVSAYNVRDGNGLTALHSAVISNDAPTVSALFPPSPRVSTAWLLTTLDHDMQWTPLHVAARPGGSVAIIIVLLRAGASLDVPDAKGVSPRDMLLERPDVLKALLVEEEEVDGGGSDSAGARPQQPMLLRVGTVEELLAQFTQLVLGHLAHGLLAPAPAVNLSGEIKLLEAFLAWLSASEGDAGSASASDNERGSVDRSSSSACDQPAQAIRLAAAAAIARGGSAGSWRGAAIACADAAAAVATTFPTEHFRVAQLHLMAAHLWSLADELALATYHRGKHTQRHHRLVPSTLHCATASGAPECFRSVLHSDGEEWPNHPGHVLTTSIPLSRSRLLHDIEQMGYLLDRQVDGGGTDEAHAASPPLTRGLLVETREAYNRLLASIPERADNLNRSASSTSLYWAGATEWATIAHWYNRMAHRETLATMPTRVLLASREGVGEDDQDPVPSAVAATQDSTSTSSLDVAQSRYLASTPHIAVIDDLLSPAALEMAYRFALGSTIWWDTHEGYLGAYSGPGTDGSSLGGAANALIPRIVDELRKAMPQVLCSHRLQQSWLYKYDQQGGPYGINVHADPAAVNLNLWLTPDEALDPDESVAGGAEAAGLVVYHVKPPVRWQFHDNGGGQADLQAKQELIRTSANTTISYRQNRAVIFDSKLLHASGRVDGFRRGYRHRRVNWTFLFGKPGDKCVAPET